MRHEVQVPSGDATCVTKCKFPVEMRHVSRSASSQWRCDMRHEVQVPRGDVTCVTKCKSPVEMRHASRIADWACPLYWSQCKKGHAESAFRGACRTKSLVMSKR